jgi:hypothetical protein
VGEGRESGGDAGGLNKSFVAKDGKDAEKKQKASSIWFVMPAKAGIQTIDGTGFRRTPD